jgi:hypothetical protein
LAARVQAAQSLFATRGDDLPPPAYSQALGGGYTLKLIVNETSAVLWQIVVALEPPLKATAVLAFGPQEFRSELDSAGMASFTSLPAGLLTDREGPPLSLWLE